MIKTGSTYIDLDQESPAFNYENISRINLLYPHSILTFQAYPASMQYQQD